MGELGLEKRREQGRRERISKGRKKENLAPCRFAAPLL